jgi:hypothetical protein
VRGLRRRAKLSDQEALAQVGLATAPSDDPGYAQCPIRESAVAKLTDRALLQRVALDGSGHEVAGFAFAKVAADLDEASLATYALRARSGAVRWQAAQRTRDQAVLCQVLRA